MKQKTHRLLSLLLTLALVLGMLPAMSMTAAAYTEGDIEGTTGTGTEADPVICDTFAEFKAAMESTEITYVKLNGVNEVMPSRETLGAAISNTTYKVLTIEGTNTFTSPLNGTNDCLIWPRANLTINGTGTLKYVHGNTGGTGAVINMASSVSLIINGNVTLAGGANGGTFGKAIEAQAGTTTINGGSFIGYSALLGDKRDISAILISGSANVTIKGGKFYSSHHSASSADQKVHSLSITSTATGTISIKEGTFPQGINIKASGKTIGNCGYFDTAKASITADGNAVATTASTDVLNGKNVVVTDTSIIIASVVVAVTEPVAGAQPKNGVSNTDNVTVTITDWYHNGVKMLATDTFAAGETYKVHVIVKPNSGYEFADNPTATFNGSTAGTIYMYGKDYINYYAEFTAPTEPIGSVDVTVTEPVAGAHPQSAVSNTANVSVISTEWLLDHTTKLSASYTFEAGKTYQVIVRVSADSGYALASTPTCTFNVSTPGTFGYNVNGILCYAGEFTAAAAEPAGYTVSGTATSFHSNTDEVIIQLTESGASEPAYEAVVKGNSASYSIAGVAPGTYTMKVMKKNHVTREYTVTVSAENVTQNVKIHLLGDVNGNGRIQSNDLTMVYAHVSGAALITDSYILACADVNGNGRIQSNDITRILGHVSGGSPLW